MKKFYNYVFLSQDESGITEEGLYDVTDNYPADMSVAEAREDLVNFLSQTDEAYVDKWGFIHEICKEEDQIFSYIFEVVDDIWEDVTGETGYWLADENNGDMPEDVRAAFEKIYKVALSKAA